MPTRKTRITVNLPDHIAKAVKTKAGEDNRSVANYIAQLIQEDVQSPYGQSDIPDAIARESEEKLRRSAVAARGVAARRRGNGASRPS